MMNRNPESFDANPTLDLDAAPRALRLPVGAAIFSVRGTAWITQEHLRDDVILAPGERFDVKSRNLILASAVGGDAVLHLVQPAAARAHVHRTIHEFARAQAADLRRREVSRVLEFVSTSVSRRLLRLREVFAPRPRATSH